MTEARLHRIFWIVTAAFMLFGAGLHLTGSISWWVVIVFALMPTIVVGTMFCLLLALWMMNGDNW